MSTENPQFDRRQALGVLFAGGLAAYVASSLHNDSPSAGLDAPIPSTVPAEIKANAVTISGPTPTEIPYSPLVIDGKFPEDRFNFSPVIKANDLIPTVLPENLSSGDLMRSGVNYLRKAVGALEALPAGKLRTMADMMVVSDLNFPIALSSSDTSTTVIRKFLQYIDEGKIEIVDESFDEKGPLLGTYNYEKYDSARGWHLSSKIKASPIRIYYPYSEEANTKTKMPTDLQYAARMVHEFAHVLQVEALLRQVVLDNKADIANSGNSESFVKDLVDRKGNQNMIRMNAIVDKTAVKGTVNFIEAQANQVAQSVLQAMKVLNGDTRMPGTEDDRYPIDPHSLHQTFQRAIVFNRNIFDTDWLLLHANTTN